MLIRAIALSLALLIGIGAIIPIATEFADAENKAIATTQEETLLERSKEILETLVAVIPGPGKTETCQRQTASFACACVSSALQRHERPRRARLPIAQFQNRRPPEMCALSHRNLRSFRPATRHRADGKQHRPRLLNFSSGLITRAGDQVGSASISVVGPAVADPQVNSRNKSVGGVATTSLRREVINRMIQENGWVVNDYQKEIGGQPVYVVVAQSQARNGKVQSRMFYFTEVDGRIYSVATNSPVEESERLAEESEKVINSLQRRVRPAQRASLK